LYYTEVIYETNCKVIVQLNRAVSNWSETPRYHT